MHTHIYRILIAAVLASLCLPVTGSSSHAAESSEPLPRQAHPRLLQSENSQPRIFELPPHTAIYELPFNIDELTADPTWPPMPFKRRIYPVGPLSSGPVVEGLQIKAQAEKEQYEAIEPILVRITVKNTSGKELELKSTGMHEKDFMAEVSHGTHGIMPLTRYGEMLDPSSARVPYTNFYRGIQPSLLKPHQEWSCSLVINQITDMTLSGSYFVRIKSSHLKGLISNPIQIDVFPRNTLTKAENVKVEPPK